MLKQEIPSIKAIFNLIDFLIDKKFKNISINFCYIDDDDLPSISIYGTEGKISEGDINHLFLHPELKKRESLDNFPIINSCFNISKKIDFKGSKNKNIFSISYENTEKLDPYLEYKKVGSDKTQSIEINEDYIFIRFSKLEEIRTNNQIVSSNNRKPHITFFNLMKEVKENIATRYYKKIKEGINFGISTKSTSQFLNYPYQNIIEELSPFQEEDPQCQELETRSKTLNSINVKIKPFLISHENNTDNDFNSKNHGIFFMHRDIIIFFDQWDLCSIKKKRIFAKDPNKTLRIRVILEGDINFSDDFSINPITNKLKVSNNLIRLIETQIEVALSQSLSLLKNFNQQEDLELQNIAKSDALAAFKELIYTKKYNREDAIKKISKNGEMLKFDFIEKYLRESKI